MVVVRFVIATGCDPLGTAGAAATLVFVVVLLANVVAPRGRFAAAGRAEGADTAPARAEADPSFLAPAADAPVVDVAVADAGRAVDVRVLAEVGVVAYDNKENSF